MNREFFPLSLDQQTVVVWAAGAPAGLLNLALRLDVEDDLDEALFQKALKVTCERLPYSRVRLHDGDNGETVQYVSDPEELTLPEWADCTGWPEKKISGQISKWAMTAFPNKLRDVQLFHAELLRTPGGKHTVFFCGHHIIMDIYAVVYFVSYLDGVYYALKNGTELPREGASPKEAVADRNGYLQSEKYKKDMDWWKNEFKTEPLFTSINGLGGHEFISGKRYGRDRSLLQMIAKEKTFELPAELEAKVDELSRKMQVSPGMIYCFGLRCYLASVCHTEDVSLQIPISLRATLLQKTSGLTAAEAFSFRADIPSSASFLEGIAEMDRIDRNYLKHANIPDPNQKVKDFFGAPRECNYHSVTFSYVPFVNFEKIHLKVKATKIDSGVAITPVYILLMHTEQGKGSDMIYQYSAGYVKPESIDKCHAFLVRFLEAGFKEPDKSIGELTESCKE